jgi:hypothetical protein
VGAFLAVDHCLDLRARKWFRYGYLAYVVGQTTENDDMMADRPSLAGHGQFSNRSVVLPQQSSHNNGVGDPFSMPSSFGSTQRLETSSRQSDFRQTTTLAQQSPTDRFGSNFMMMGSTVTPASDTNLRDSRIVSFMDQTITGLSRTSFVGGKYTLFHSDRFNSFSVYFVQITLMAFLTSKQVTTMEHCSKR